MSPGLSCTDAADLWSCTCGESRRTNEDCSVVAYLQQTGNSVAKVIHNFGRADQVDRAELARLVASISP